MKQFERLESCILSEIPSNLVWKFCILANVNDTEPQSKNDQIKPEKKEVLEAVDTSSSEESSGEEETILSTEQLEKLKQCQRLKIACTNPNFIKVLLSIQNSKKPEETIDKLFSIDPEFRSVADTMLEVTGFKKEIKK